MNVRIESAGDFERSVYDGRAAAYDRLIGARWYNRLLWDTSPDDYAAFAREAVASARGPLLEVAAGTARASAESFRASDRTIVVTDRSRDMLNHAAAHIAGEGPLRPGIRFVQADAFDLPFGSGGFDTVLCLGFLHLVDDPVSFVNGLRAQARPGGRVFVSSLVAATVVGAHYLSLLHRLGEVATPRTPAEIGRLVRGAGAPARVDGLPGARRVTIGAASLDQGKR
ncbi:class I SAM-dependent methyltransferase [Micropruina sp.]|uniref:class I SAM-dependent methyltransferase n=1 Tax=Micropruina sp. TaxID=2737536 RepID=UPI0039E5ABD9